MLVLAYCDIPFSICLLTSTWYVGSSPFFKFNGTAKIG